MSCKCKVTTQTIPPACPAGCIRGGYHIIHAADSVGPCGAVGVFDLAEISVNITNQTTCGANLRYTLQDWDPLGFEIVTRSGSAITWTTKEDAVVGKYYKIRYGVHCDGKGLSDIADVLVGIKNLCATADCSTGQSCNRCTGGCVSAGVDISTGNECINC